MTETQVAPTCPRCGEAATYEQPSFRAGYRAFWCANAHGWLVPDASAVAPKCECGPLHVAMHGGHDPRCPVVAKPVARETPHV